MTIANRCTESLLYVYKSINRTGLLDVAFIRSLYISSYFTYKKYLEDSYAKLVKYHPFLFQNGNIIDVGANIGYTAFVFSKILQHPFKIIAFEPEKRNIELLNQASQKYGFIDKLVSVAAAVGEQEGEIELWQNDAHNGDHRILTQELKKQMQGHISIQKVPMVTIDNYLKKMGPDFPISFIKVDVQGYELAVCNGMVETLKQYPNAVVSFEYCPTMMKSLGFNPHTLLQFFIDKNYGFYILDKKHKLQPYDVKQYQFDSRDYVDILCSRRNLVRGV